MKQPTLSQFERLIQALHLETPVVALYDCAAGDAFAPLVSVKGRACCFAYYGRWVKGETVVVERADEAFGTPTHGCPGLQRALGLGGPYPPWMANFLTDGAKGAPMGEGLKATPALAQAFLDRARPVEPATDQVLLGPLRLEAWDKVCSVTFFADPDRLSALMTLASYWSAAAYDVVAPFSSGCGLLWRDLRNDPEDHAILGGTDIAMRRYLPPQIMCLTVSPRRFAQMLTFPDEAFLKREWWAELLAARTRQ